MDVEVVVVARVMGRMGLGLLAVREGKINLSAIESVSDAERVCEKACGWIERCGRTISRGGERGNEAVVPDDLPALLSIESLC